MHRLKAESQGLEHRVSSVLDVYGTLLDFSIPKDETYWRVFFQFQCSSAAFLAFLDNCVVRSTRIADSPEKLAILGTHTFHPQYVPIIQQFLLNTVTTLEAYREVDADLDSGFESESVLVSEDLEMVLNAFVTVGMFVQWLGDPARPWASASSLKENVFSELLEPQTLIRLTHVVLWGIKVCSRDDYREWLSVEHDSRGFEARLAVKLAATKLYLKLHWCVQNTSIAIQKNAGTLQSLLDVLVLKDLMDEEKKHMIGYEGLGDTLRLIVLVGLGDFHSELDIDNSSAINYTISQFLLVGLRLLYNHSPDLLVQHEEQSGFLSWISSKIMTSESYDAYLRNYLEDDMDAYYTRIKPDADDDDWNDDIPGLEYAELVPILIILNDLILHCEPYEQSLVISETGIGTFELIVSLGSFLVQNQRGSENNTRCVRLIFQIFDAFITRRPELLVSNEFRKESVKLCYQKFPFIKPHGASEHSLAEPASHATTVKVAFAVLDVFQGEMRFGLTRRTFDISFVRRLNANVFTLVTSLIDLGIVGFPKRGSEYCYYNWTDFWNSKFMMLRFLVRLNARDQISGIKKPITQELCAMEYLLTLGSRSSDSKWNDPSSILPQLVYKLFENSSCVRQAWEAVRETSDGLEDFPLIGGLLKQLDKMLIFSKQLGYESIMDQILEYLNETERDLEKGQQSLDTLYLQIASQSGVVSDEALHRECVEMIRSSDTLFL